MTPSGSRRKKALWPSNITETGSLVKEQPYASHGDVRSDSFLRNVVKSFGLQTPPPKYEDIRSQETTRLAIKDGYPSGSVAEFNRGLTRLPPKPPQKLMSAYTYEDLDEYSKYARNKRNQDFEAYDLLDATRDLSRQSAYEGTKNAPQEHSDVGRRGYQCLFTECGYGFFPAEDWMRSHLVIAHSVPEEALESYVLECRDVAKRQEYGIQPEVGQRQSLISISGSDKNNSPSMTSEEPKHGPKKNVSMGLSGSFWGVFQEYEEQKTPGETQLADSRGTESDSVDTDDCSVDVEESLQSGKEHVLNYLMVCVHDMFSLAGSSNGSRHTGTGSSYSLQQTGESSASGSNNSGRKRARNESSGDGDGGDDGNDKSKSRKKPRDESDADLKKLHKKLACPYYKQDPQKQHSSGACCGPGWDSVHRIKAHLYRVHAMPLHCRRCYVTFASESLLTDHSRSANSCIVRDAIPMDGFNKDQEKALKGRKTMFRAQTEEEKWKIVYLILFPDTPLGEMPSPYYDIHEDKRAGEGKEHSPKSPDVQQFDAFLKRELPRAIRKTLQALLESKLGPIEETLKNELEGIVRDAHESLTRSYLESAQATEGMQGEHPAQSTAPESIDALSQYLVPPEASTSVPTLPLTADNLASETAFSDSAYHSVPDDDAVLNDSWLDNLFGEGDGLHELFAENTTGEADVQFTQLYTGKGKEAVRNSSWMQE